MNIDTTKPHSARMYDYYLGGKDHYQVDEEAAGHVLTVYPGIKTCARTNRAFMHRATRWLAGEAGVRQFLDIGTGIPTEPNLHQVAQGVAPDARIVYADNDPIVLAYAQALLHGTSQGRTAYLQADVREPERILKAPELHETLDMNQPVALSFNALFHFVPDEYGPYDLVRQFVDALPSGSFLVLSHCTSDFDPDTWGKVVEIYRQGGIPSQVRSKDEVERFFEGLELIEPGVSEPHLWKPDGEVPALSSTDVSLWVGVARKP
ncbi:SAM-dependent methyltransferase [Streptomyces cucumeris]|uniref:SAM-dependent methyltransferase n=1 Tax=Streptomyces cucumeris TaxID=2962890 RepID=UPI0020C8B4F4|nr:SAM-dependent methyltransferase [Streptomyces sp. NEAU-Y11]MCP9207592.1 SAM-dependent methyltransferase [Streptomyces sp. NEAU-Y11]